MFEKEVVPDDYFDDPVNTTLINERGIEIPLGIRYMNEVGMRNNLIEVGCVMPFYGYSEHLIIDQFEKNNPSGEVLNIDAMTFDFIGKDILCLSTIEHVGKTDYDNEDVNPQKAIDMLDKFTDESRSMIVSWGTGYHLELDEYVKSSLDKWDWFGYIKKEATLWEFTDKDLKVWDCKFDEPFRFANGNVFLLKGLE